MNIVEIRQAERILSRIWRVQKSALAIRHIKFSIRQIKPYFVSVSCSLMELVKAWLWYKISPALYLVVIDYTYYPTWGDQLNLDGLCKAGITSVEQLLSMTEEEVKQRCNWQVIPGGLTKGMARYGLEFKAL